MSADPRRADPLDELRVLVDEPSFAQHVCRCVFQLKNAKDAFKRASWRCDFSGNFELQQDECDQFGLLFKACGNNYFAQIAHIFRQIL